jgi:uncharacterized repeat protein (TIGR01451 family)
MTLQALEKQLSLSGITVPISSDLDITYTTLALAFPITSYTGGTIELDTGSYISDKTSSVNTVTHVEEGTWNNGTTDIPVDNSTLVSPKNFTQSLQYGKISKSVNNNTPVIWNIIRYTIQFQAAENISFDTTWVWTYIEDVLDDGLSYSWTISSINSWTWNVLSFSWSTIDTDGDTTIIWKLDSGEIQAWETLTISYDVLVDWIFEGSGIEKYINTESLSNTAQFTGTISDSTNNEIWWYTAPSIIGTTVNYNAWTSVSAPEPTSEKRLISIEFPDTTLYDFSNPLPVDTYIPVGSKLRFAVSMDFPNVHSSGSIVTDALPLLAGPNDSIYDITFQTDNSLRDINNTLVAINDDNTDGTADSSFNGLTLSGTMMPNSSWVQDTPANNIEFHLWSWSGAKTFSILFTADILATEPSWYNGEWFLPEKNVSIASFNDGAGFQNNLNAFEALFTIALPAVWISKTFSGSNVESGSNIDYSIEIENTGKATAYLENIKDILPDGLTLQSYSMTASGFTLSWSTVTQSWSELSLSFNTGAILGRSELPKESSIIIDYTVQADSSLLINNLSKENTISLDYYASKDAPSNEVNNFGPISDTASFITAQPTITRTLISTTQTGSSSNNVKIWEEATFETIITLPAGSYDSSSFQDTSHSQLDFLNASVISTSWSLSFSTGTGFTWNTGTFGTIVNSDTDSSTDETIVIHSDYRVENTASNGSRYTRGRFYYGGTNIYRNNNIVVTQPSILLNKSVNPLTGDAGDTLDYTISLNNTGNANAYDMVLTDTLDNQFTFVTGSLVLNSFTWSEADFLSSTGITLNELTNGSSTSVTFQVTVNNDVAPDESIPNRVDLSYDSLTDDNSIYEKDYSTNSTANFTIDNISISHSLTATNNPDTSTGLFNASLFDLHIWEQATYITSITVPESTFTGMTFTQTLPDWFKFLTWSIGTGALSHSLSWVTISPDNTIIFSLGDIINPGWSGDQTLNLHTQVILTNSGWQEKWLSTALASWEWLYSTSQTTNLDIVEPNLTISKDYSISTWDSWDTAITTITIENTGSVAAYDLSWTDTQPSDVTTTWNFYTSSWATMLAAGWTITYSYSTTLDNTVQSGDMLTGTASLSYTSAPWVNTDEKTHPTIIDSDTIQIVAAGWLSATLDTASEVKIWDTSSYTIKVPIPEWTTNTLYIEDILPDGIAVHTGSILISSSGSMSYSWAAQPTFTGTGMYWNFTDIINSNTDNAETEELTIHFNTLTLNTAFNNVWDTKSHDVKALYNGWDEKTASTANITIVEPFIALDISNSYTQENSLVKYTFTLTNTGSVTAYDIDISTLIPGWVIYTGSLNITNTWWAVNLNKSGNNFTLDSLGVNTGNPLSFEVYADVDHSHNLWDTLTLTGNLVYTSQSGIYSPTIISNSDNTERSGLGGINDHTAAAMSSFIYQDAILDESISVVDDNGWDSLWNETYTYTVTLTNTWNVLLTDIPVSIDIPEYLSGVTLSVQSIPAGSSHTYISTGGTQGNGLLSVTGISIPVGESREILYKINSLPDTPNNTTIANVWDSNEGAVWWNPDIDITIIAPELVTSSQVKDENGSRFIVGDYVTHTSTVENTGSSTGTNIVIELTYPQDITSYESNSLEFSTGSMIQTGSILVDEASGIISFTLSSIAPWFLETFTFQSKAIWKVWEAVDTNISASIDEWMSSSTLSNEIILVTATIKWGWSSRKNKENSPSPIKSPEENPEVIEEKIVKLPQPDIEKIQKFLDDREKKKEILKKLLDEIDQKWESLLKRLPKVLPKTGTQIWDRVITKSNPKVDTSLPDENIFSKAGSTNTDINFWIDTLPKEDRNAQKYVIIPSNGLVIRVNEVAEKTSDLDNMINGQEININEYLKSWALEYPWTSTKWYGEVGNKVIFWHSSYWKEDDWRYKTHFQKIIELDTNEQIWIYEQDITGAYIRYQYVVTQSYNTENDDVDALLPGTGKNLTLFTCTPIWGIAGRWIIKAKYIDEVAKNLESEIYFSDIDSTYKNLANSFIKQVADLEDETEKQQTLYKVYYKLDSYLEKYVNSPKTYRLLEFIKYRIAEEILKLQSLV